MAANQKYKQDFEIRTVRTYRKWGKQTFNSYETN
jgi:hypothetical protein